MEQSSSFSCPLSTKSKQNPSLPHCHQQLNPRQGFLPDHRFGGGCYHPAHNLAVPTLFFAPYGASSLLLWLALKGEPVPSPRLRDSASVPGSCDSLCGMRNPPYNYCKARWTSHQLLCQIKVRRFVIHSATRSFESNFLQCWSDDWKTQISHIHTY